MGIFMQQRSSTTEMRLRPTHWKRAVAMAQLHACLYEEASLRRLHHALLLWELQYFDLRVLIHIFNLCICYGCNGISAHVCLHVSMLCASVEQGT